ncbi:RNI-like protein [Piedraia hortae CBS 480.64]|uniref:RNI-like protein n=1 Tax=Piedraia hortae CBS 480.64 TaxID=1314780 RepID=A0A6A7BV82_9PEZI|nr:RNI-like protein [Piedraia hortae CBS 480.64]
MADDQIFSLKGKSLKLDNANDISPHIIPLQNTNDIREIHLEGNTLGPAACIELAPYIAAQKGLRVANLADIFTGRLLSEIPTALDSLLQVLLTLPELHTVNLSDNAFGLNTVAPLESFLERSSPLKHLYLNNNGLGPEAGARVAKALAKLAEKKKQDRAPDLETIICGRNRLESGSMEAWAEAFRANNKVTTVKMVQNGIRKEGIDRLIRKGLSQCNQLKVLDLQDNTFTRFAATALAETLPSSWPQIQELGVGDCLLSSAGGRLLASALAKGKNANIKTLRLQFNELRSEVLALLCDAIDKVAALQRVELNGNKFEAENPLVEKLTLALKARRKDDADDDDEEWGLDELDELEGSDDDDEDESEGEDEAEVESDEEEKIVKEDERNENEPVAQEKDKDVDALARALEKTEL